MRLGLYGGTFDPPHIGHLIVAQDALAALRLDRVLFIPAGVPPHKQDRSVTPADVRMRMLEAALAGDARFGIDRVELDRSGPSFTVDTLEAIRALHPRDETFLLLGADQFNEFRTWRDPERVSQLSRIAVLRRGDAVGVAAADIEAFGAQWVNVTRIDVSSSEIRRRIKEKESVRYLVPPAVEAILTELAIYDS